MKLIIPMAGLGTRFQKVAHENPEYQKPKPFINVRGLPMIRWATGSLPFVGDKLKMSDLIFVILQEHDDKFEIEKNLKEIYSSDITVIKLLALTRGAAETAYKANEYIDPEEEIIVSDSDHFFDGASLAKVIEEKEDDIAGAIPVFTPPNDGIPRWSYSLIEGDDDIITEVKEKSVELMNKGADANIGAYYFSKGKYFMDEVANAIEENAMTGEEGKKEFYVAPIYDRLIKKGMKIKAAHIPEVWGLGTPKDLESFLKTCPNQKPIS